MQVPSDSTRVSCYAIFNIQSFCLFFPTALFSMFRTTDTSRYIIRTLENIISSFQDNCSKTELLTCDLQKFQAKKLVGKSVFVM